MAYKVALQAVFAVLTAAATIDKRITGGELANASEFPYIVKVGPDCGGSLLDSTTVLTAGHCSRSLKDVANIIFHSSYVSIHPSRSRFKGNNTHYQAYYGNDIALLKLSTPIEADRNISYAKLPTKGLEPKANSIGIAAGCCPPEWRRIPVENEFCAGGNGKGACSGDSGGPFVEKETGVLIGISNTASCGDYTSFTKVAGHISFIEEHMTPGPDFVFPQSDDDDRCDGGKLIPGPLGQGEKCVSASGGLYEPMKAV
ncbi:peptidase S1 domain protein [Metarhizium robertsii]|uniref:Peptidase S1 domain protein n=1 Tax=Metarhizium robertsii TaxID=568076 RepID=A0A014N4A3_9HYPO|nr:peptidase S1 domain protein [Metarhizium robertsii]